MTATGFRVELTHDAEDDLEAIHGWLAENRSPDHADALLDDLLAIVASLEEFPLRGAVPAELDQLGIRDFRQMGLPPYRLIYRILGERVVILLIADGRRDMQALLERRLLGRQG